MIQTSCEYFWKDGEGNKYTLGRYPENETSNNKITESAYGILYLRFGNFNDPNNPDSFSNHPIWGEDLYSGLGIDQV